MIRSMLRLAILIPAMSFSATALAQDAGAPVYPAPSGPLDGVAASFYSFFGPGAQEAGVQGMTETVTSDWVILDFDDHAARGFGGIERRQWFRIEELRRSDDIFRMHFETFDINRAAVQSDLERHGCWVVSGIGQFALSVRYFQEHFNKNHTDSPNYPLAETGILDEATRDALRESCNGMSGQRECPTPARG